MRLRVQLVAPILVLCAFAFGCAEPLELADWTMPVPEGTRIIEHAAVPIDERTERIELVEDLRLGANASDPSQAFYLPRDVDVDREGNIYVLDAGNHCVKVYGPDGRHLRILGRRGEGPAEFAFPRNVVVAGDRLVVKNLYELSVWALDGEHLADHRLVAAFSTVFGRADGSLVANHVPEVEPSAPQISISSFSADGEQQVEYIQLPVAPNLAGPEFAASRDGALYVTSVAEYQILAMSPDGSARWALRVPWGRPRPDEVPNLPPVTVELPETRMPALSHLAVDGHGHLYVYFYDPSHGLSPVRPVDVYSPEGDHLFSGMIDDARWVRSRGDHVYMPVFDPRSDEHHIVRYRLVEPFE